MGGGTHQIGRPPWMRSREPKRRTPAEQARGAHPTKCLSKTPKTNVPPTLNAATQVPHSAAQLAATAAPNAGTTPWGRNLPTRGANPDQPHEGQRGQANPAPEEPQERAQPLLRTTPAPRTSERGGPAQRPEGADIHVSRMKPGRQLIHDVAAWRPTEGPRHQPQRGCDPPEAE